MLTANICYFSGTGNSYSIAKRIEAILSTNTVASKLYALVNSNAIEIVNCDFLYLIFPVYSLTLPAIVLKFIRSIPKAKRSPKIILIVTEGAKDEEGWSLDKSRKMFERKGYSVLYSNAILMPTNWTTVQATQSESEILEIINESEKLLQRMMENILRNETYHKSIIIPKYGPLLSFVMKVFFPVFGKPILGILFHTNSRCTNCKKCIRMCPVNAIVNYKNRPKWTLKCEQCMRCVSICPQNAIIQLESILHGSRNKRYFNSNFYETDLLKYEKNLTTSST